MTIWFDVTTTLGWTRPALGIVRVEAESARYFLDTCRPDIRFCRFDLKRGIYSEVSSGELRQALERLDAGGNSLGQPQSRATVAIDRNDGHESPFRRVRRWGVRTMNQARRRVRAGFCQDVGASRGVLRGLLCATREARDAFIASWQASRGVEIRPHGMQSSARRPRSLCTAPFCAGDVYVSMGLDWYQKDLGCLYRLKRAHGLKVLLFCYDTVPVKFPHLVVRKVAAEFPGYLVDVARSADDILCISECSRTDLRQFLESAGAPVPNLRVVRLGCDITAVAEIPPTGAVADVLACRFILFVSTIERRKNHESLYHAYTRLVDAGHIDLPLLVFVGMPGWGVSDLLSDLRLDPRSQPYIRILNHVSDSDLARLYGDAYFTVYPSLYEGWGLPIAESLAHGKFCLASDAGSIPEVGGDLVEYIDPWDVPRWAERLGWYFAHPEEVERRAGAIRLGYRPTAWMDTGAAVLRAADDLAAPPPIPLM